MPLGERLEAGLVDEVAQQLALGDERPQVWLEPGSVGGQELERLVGVAEHDRGRRQPACDVEQGADQPVVRRVDHPGRRRVQRVADETGPADLRIRRRSRHAGDSRPAERLDQLEVAEHDRRRR